MRVVAFCGSPRRDGNTVAMTKEALASLEGAGARTELIQLAGERLRGCRACYKCKERKDRRCSMEDDQLNEHLARMLQADGIILASPTYFADMTAEMKALVDRSGMVARVNGDMLRRKVGAAVTVARRGGAIHTFDSLNHFFLIGQMIVVGSSYWNLGFGANKGDVLEDEEAMGVMRTLGENMAWAMERLSAS